MTDGISVGLHGKLPQQADFISRHLPMTLITGWDEWMQRSLLASQEALGNRWLEVYLTSPIWRFVCSRGVWDQQVWAGIMLPSVDKVGRYYPLLLAQPLPGDALPTVPLIEADAWFLALEAFAIRALEGTVPLAELEHQLSQLPLLACSQTAVDAKWEVGRPLALFQQDSLNPLHTGPHLLHELLRQRFPAYSLWASAGSERVAPSHLISGYLPSPQCYTALIAGDWSQQGWSTPFDVITPLAFSGQNGNNTEQIQNE